jgi:hypothetical protein
MRMPRIETSLSKGKDSTTHEIWVKKTITHIIFIIFFEKFFQSTLIFSFSVESSGDCIPKRKSRTTSVQQRHNKKLRSWPNKTQHERKERNGGFRDKERQREGREVLFLGLGFFNQSHKCK